MRCIFWFSSNCFCRAHVVGEAVRRLFLWRAPRYVTRGMCRGGVLRSFRYRIEEGPCWVCGLVDLEKRLRDLDENDVLWVSWSLQEMVLRVGAPKFGRMCLFYLSGLSVGCSLSRSRIFRVATLCIVSRDLSERL